MNNKFLWGKYFQLNALNAASQMETARLLNKYKIKSDISFIFMTYILSLLVLKHQSWALTHFTFVFLKPEI